MPVLYSFEEVVVVEVSILLPPCTADSIGRDNAINVTIGEAVEPFPGLCEVQILVNQKDTDGDYFPLARSVGGGGSPVC